MPAPDDLQPSRPRIRSGLRIAVASAVLLAGTACAGSTSATSVTSSGQGASTPSVSASSPSVAPGESLAALGFLHGPQGFTVPTGLDVRQSVDQSNVVTLVVPADQGPELLGYLEARLPAAGYTITARSADSLIFGNAGWQGAFTMSDSLAGLTLRRLDQKTP